MSPLDAELKAIIERIRAEAYMRGKEDAKAELLAFLSSAGQPQSDDRAADRHGDDADHESRNRAPRGTARTLIHRAMRGGGGIEPKAAVGAAETEMERRISVSAIRAELRRGKDSGRYVERAGRWFLAESEKEAEAPTKEPSAPVYSLATGRG